MIALIFSVKKSLKENEKLRHLYEKHKTVASLFSKRNPVIHNKTKPWILLFLKNRKAHQKTNNSFIIIFYIFSLSNYFIYIFEISLGILILRLDSHST